MQLTSRPNAPVACDMTTARDTPEQRIAEYAELFARALLSRERRADRVVFAFRADAREQVEDLARREYACCPFLDHAVETGGDQVTWTIGGDERPDVQTTLDAFHDLPDHPGTGFEGLMIRIATDAH